MFPTGWKEPVTRLRSGDPKVDPLGVPIRGTGSTSSEGLPPALFAPGESEDGGRAGEEIVYTRGTVYWPNEFPDVLSSDRLQMRGSQWSVVGEPSRWPMGLSVSVRKETREWHV